MWPGGRPKSSCPGLINPGLKFWWAFEGDGAEGDPNEPSNLIGGKLGFFSGNRGVIKAEGFIPPEGCDGFRGWW